MQITEERPLCLSVCHRADISVALTSTKAYHKRHINNQRRLGVRLYHYSLMPAESWFSASHIFLPSAIAYLWRFITIQSSVLFRVMGETASSHLVHLPNPFSVHFWVPGLKMMVLWHIWEALSYKSIPHTAQNPAVLNPTAASQKPPGTESKRVEDKQHLERKKKWAKVTRHWDIALTQQSFTACQDVQSSHKLFQYTGFFPLQELWSISRECSTSS